MTDEQIGFWEAVSQRNPDFDGQFVFAVKTTGIYCRPSCKSRRPNRQNVLFFSGPDEAESAGFRACKRCTPREHDPRATLIRAVCDHLESHLDQPNQLTLATLGVKFGFAPEHLQRLFKKNLGISPRQFVEAKRAARLKDTLRQSIGVAGAIYGAGFGSGSQVYENTNRYLGMTPTTYRRKGEGMNIHYATAESDLGTLLIGATERGVCAVGIYDDLPHAQAALAQEFPRATLQQSEGHLIGWLRDILAHVAGDLPKLALPLDIQATAFQWRVWQALQAIPRGQTRTYTQIAQEIGQPNAVRAVANACAHNQAAILIPCHRVVGRDGRLAGYKWGIERKKQLIEQER